MVRSSARDHRAAPELDGTAAVRAGVPARPAHLMALQRAAGNAAVAQQVQRYAVGVPATASYSALMSWLGASNPYAPDSAAKTNAKFKYDAGGWVVTGSAGAWTVTPGASASVTMVKSVDMPTWAAKDPKLQASWTAGVAALRAHETLHENLADTWKTTLQGRLSSFSITSSAANETGAGAEASAKLATEWQGWINEHQTAQEGLDPYAVVVADPYPPAPAPAPAPESSTDSGPEATFE